LFTQTQEDHLRMKLLVAAAGFAAFATPALAEFYIVQETTTTRSSNSDLRRENGRYCRGFAGLIVARVAANSQRLWSPRGRIADGLVLGFGVELGADQDHDDRQPNPKHKRDDGAERTVSLVEATDILRVPSK
jgi:hypothetical protein